MAEIIAVVLGILVALSIFAYGTWLLISRLRRGEKKARSLKEWVKHVFEAIWGL